MLVLAVDTSGRQGSIALCRGDRNSFEVLQLVPLEGGTYSAELVPSIAAALQRHHLDKASLDGLVVVSGPGSFTGLRVGLATVKGLCEVLQKPLATVSMLEALAVVHGSAGETVTAILDAGRGEVYAGEYQITAERVTLVREAIMKLEELGTGSRRVESRLLTPDPKIAERLSPTKLAVSLVPPVQADQIGRIGITKLLAGDLADPATVDVNYIRRSDAEIFVAPSH